jgi:hypothetical protein
VLGTLVAALMLSAVAYAADDGSVDGDLGAPGNQNSASITTSAGSSVTTSAGLVITRAGNQAHLELGNVVVLEYDPATSNLPAGATVSDASFAIPGPWTTNGQQVAATSTIQFTAPAASATYTVHWKVKSGPACVTASGNQDCFNMSGAFTVNLTISAPPNQAPSIEAGGPYSGTEGSSIAIDGASANDPDGDSLTYSWTKDESGLDGGGTCTLIGATTLSPTLNCDDDGSVTLTLAVDDGIGHTPSDTATVNVSNADPSATPSIPAGNVNEGDSFSLSLSSPSDPGSNDTFTYQFDCGDGGGYNAASSTASRTCPTTDNGSRSVKLKILDDDGGFAEYTGTVTVVNVPPEITLFTCPTDPVAVNTSITLTGAFTDVGTADTHTASIAWGDGSSAAATVTQGAGSSGSVSGSHAYSAARIYTPSLTVTDDDGGSDTESCEYVVVYDPSAGFVTGGGWINSPAGAYLADPTMTGKATFGFVSKYKKGATTPDGSTEFQFHAAGLNFKSTAYQWLVVAGWKATYKGWGTINGQGNYGFLLSALDGSPDMFRIKIWDVGSGEVVYDNNLGGGDDAEPATALGGGSIVIHTGKK